MGTPPASKSILALAAAASIQVDSSVRSNIDIFFFGKILNLRFINIKNNNKKFNIYQHLVGLNQYLFLLSKNLYPNFF